MRNPRHNCQPRSYTPHTDEWGRWVEVDDEAGVESAIHVLTRRGRQEVGGCRLRYFVDNFLFYGPDLDRMMFIHFENSQDDDDQSH